MSGQYKEGLQQRIDSGVALIEMLTGIMSQGMEQGLLRSDVNPKEMARAYLAFQNGLINLWLTAPEQFSLKTSAELAGTWLLALLWTPSLFVPLHYLGRGYLTSWATIWNLWLFQMPVNAAAVLVVWWLMRKKKG